MRTCAALVGGNERSIRSRRPMKLGQCELCPGAATALIGEPDPFMDRRLSDITRLRLVCDDCNARFSNHDDIRFSPFHSTASTPK